MIVCFGSATNICSKFRIWTIHEKISLFAYRYVKINGY